MTAKQCAKCKRTKPAASFPPDKSMKTGLSSWCRTCFNERTRTWRQENPDYVEATNKGKTTYTDPIEYSRRHCLHIATYADRAINKFERATGREAPPHLTQIRNLARNLGLEHPPGRKLGNTATCPYCGNTFETFNTSRKCCSRSCKERHRYAQRKAHDPEGLKAHNKARNEAAKTRRNTQPAWIGEGFTTPPYTTTQYDIFNQAMTQIGTSFAQASKQMTAALAALQPKDNHDA